MQTKMCISLFYDTFHFSHIHVYVYQFRQWYECVASEMKCQYSDMEFVTSKKGFKNM